VQTKTTHTPSLFSGHVLLTLVLLLALFELQAQTPWYKSNCPRSQKQAELWYFGEKCGIDFRSGDAVAQTDQNVMTAFKASAIICDSLGNLLFFTNGNKVWDRNVTLMPNATGLAGDLGATQPAIIVPNPGNSAQYYIFTVDILKFTDSLTYTTKGLSCTIIDMNERGGLGDAISSFLNKSMLSPACQKITAVVHKNTRDYWVIAHEWDSDKFYAYLLTESGIAAPVVSSAGTVNGGHRNDVNNSVGYLKISPDGKKLAAAVSQKKLIELFDFNNETGTVSNAKSYTTTKPGVNPYGIEFSPDSRYLYATVFETGGVVQAAAPSYVFQFDTRSGMNNPVIVDSVVGLRVAGMQLATDGRIYLSRTNNILSKRDSLEVIYNPNRPGNACNFDRINNIAGSSFPLLGRKSIYSLPNLVQSFVNVPPFRWDSVCHGNATQFHATNQANADTIIWKFGDGGTSTQPDPVHTFANPGSYWVTQTQMFNGQSFVDSMLVKNYPLPQISLADTILLYEGSSIHLHAGGGFTDYLWSTNSKDSIIEVKESGTYWAQVEDLHCCINSDTTFVRIFNYAVPNAFSPNGDGLNDVFKVNGLYKNISFSMIVYDRWGTQVFESDDIDKGWDGTVSGQYCPADTYVWMVSIVFEGKDIITKGDIKFKGTVTLVR